MNANPGWQAEDAQAQLPAHKLATDFAIIMVLLMLLDVIVQLVGREGVVKQVCTLSPFCLPLGYSLLA